MVRINKALEDSDIDGESLEMKWDFKRIIIGTLLAGAFLGLGLFFLFKVGDKVITKGMHDVLGVSSQKEGSGPPPNLPTKEDVSRVLSQAQQEISKLTADNLTSSQAAIQKIIQDLQSLQGGKKSPTDFFCEFVCKK